MFFLVRPALAAIFSLNLMTTAFAADNVRLLNVAATCGYTYQWLATEGGVSLQRPGVVIMLHAGYPLYEVNSTSQQADIAPRFEDGDLIISTALAGRLRQIAATNARQYKSAAVPSSPAKPYDRSDSPVSGALTINAAQISGQEALALHGTAPPNVPITITLTAELSTDLPIVVLNRTTVMSGSDGTYFAVANIGQNPHRGTTVIARATSIDGTPSAVARFIVKTPTQELNSILDGFPPK